MSFIDNINGTVMDNNTGLVWQKCSVGHNNAAACSGSVSPYTWYQAQDICGNLVLGRHADWRLPTDKELMSIVDYGTASEPAINTTYFPNTNTSLLYWASTWYTGYPDSAWVVRFSDGAVGSNAKGNANAVRCVRGGQLEFGNFTDNHDEGVFQPERRAS